MLDCSHRLHAAPPCASCCGNSASRGSEANILVLVDASGSVGQGAVDFALGKGLPAMARSLIAASARSDIAYSVGAMAFAAHVREILPMMDVRAFDPRRLPCDLRASGATLMEKALWRALEEIDAAKARQVGAGIACAGSFIVTVTDGRPTDERGALRKLSLHVARELADRNRTGSCGTFAIGVGRSETTVLRQLAPVASRVVRPAGGLSVDCWRAACRFIIAASFSAGNVRLGK